MQKLFANVIADIRFHQRQNFKSELENKTFFFLPCWAVCGILVLWPGIQPTPPAVDTWSLNHWITREVPIKLIKKKKKIPNKKSNTCWWTLNQASMLNTEAHREITALLNSLILLPAPQITIVKILMWFFPKPFLYLFMVVPRSIWDLNFPTRDWTLSPCIGSEES